MKMKTAVLAFLLAAGGAFWLAGCKGGADKAGQEVQSAQYHCPMHPTYVSDKPGDCPICGMRLVPVEPAPERDAAAPAGEETEALPDRAAVSLSPEKERLIGVRTAPAERRALTNPIRASGRIAYDPELYGAVVEYREALKAQKSVQDSPWPEVRERSEALIRSSVLRLRQMGLSQAQIERLGGAAQDPVNLLLGQKDGSLWVYAQIYEYEAGQVQAGQAMEVKTGALPGKTFRGRVVAVDTILNPETRTLRVRGELPNPDGLLKPEMYVDVVIQVDLGNKLAVPEEAVLDTGERKIVFVRKAPGRYEPREVTLGHEAGDYWEVLSGLEEGEEVVTSANFLIDSESRLKAALSPGGGGHAH